MTCPKLTCLSIRGIVFVFSSVFGFLADTYRPVAASAMASNAFLRCILSSGFPLVRPGAHERS